MNRQRVEDKWREPEIIHQQSEEIERLVGHFIIAFFQKFTRASLYILMK